MTGLSPNTTYYVRAYATNTGGTSYDGQVSFSTSAQAPTVTTQTVSDIGETTATGNGTITDLGSPNPTEHGVCWNTTGTPTISGSKTEEGAASTTGAFTSSMTGLSPNTTYYVRAYATNTGGTSYDGQVSFSTSAQAPTVTTQTVSDIGETTATGNGTITDLGSPNPTEHGVCWNTTGTPTISGSKTEEGAASTTGAFTSSMTGLSPNTTYYVRAYATNTGGTSYDGQVSFSTSAQVQAPTVTTQAVSDIGETTATGNGTITDLGSPNPTEHGVCWNTTGTPTISGSKTEEGAASTTGAFTSSMTGLSPNTTYYVRAYATNTGGTSYDGQVSFSTSAQVQAPTVTTQAVSDIGETTATGNGTITDLGSPNPTQHGVCWNTTGTPTISGSKTEEGAASTTGAFTSSMTGLSPNTTYYVRAYATNTGGTSYDGQVSFSTSAQVQASTVTTQAVSDIGETTATGNGTITDLGSPNPTQHGVCWNTTGTPTISGSKTEEGAASTTGAFTSSMTGLSPNTTYYVRAYATNTDGTAYGVDVTFTTSVPVPTVSSFVPTTDSMGSTVVITGTYFTGTEVKFGGTDAASFTVDSATQITAVVGAGFTGKVTVTTDKGTGTSAATFTYDSDPATLATGNSSTYSNTVTKVEMYNGISWVTIFSGSALLDMVTGGTFPGISNLNLPAGTYSQIKVTSNNAFPVSGMLNYSGTNYYTTGTTFGGQANLASTPTTVAGEMAVFTFYNPEPTWGGFEADVAQTYAITPITVGSTTDYQPTLRFTISNTLLLKGTAGNPSSYYFTLNPPVGSLVEP